MRPVRVELSGFRSFRMKQTVDFSGLGLFGVVGDTGAGKSSILEAIVYALYNKSTWSERDIKALMALDAETMRVDLDFEVAGIVHRVTRSASRVIGRPSIHALRCETKSEYRFDGEGPVNAEIERLTGLKYGNFIKTVVLPQGRFADLLTARDADRTAALGELLGLAEIDRIRNSMEGPYQSACSLRAELRAALRALGQDPAGRVISLRGSAEKAQTELDRLVAVQARLLGLTTESSAVRDRFTLLEAASTALEGLRTSLTLIESLRPVENELRGLLVAARLKLEAAQAEDAAAKAFVEHLRRTGMDLLSLTRVRGKLEELQRSHERVADASRQLEVEANDLARRERDIGYRRKSLEQVLAQRQPMMRVSAEAAISASAAVEHVRRCEDMWRRLSGARDVSAATLEQFESAERARGTIETQVASAETQLQEARSIAEAAAEALRRVERMDLAATIARDVHPGDPCPICLQAVPRNFEPPQVADLAGAERLFRTADLKRVRAVGELERLRERLSNNFAERATARLGKEEAARSLERLTCEAGTLGIAVTGVEDAEALVSVRAAAAEARRSFEECDRTLKEFEARYSQREKEIGNVGAAVERDRSHHARSSADNAATLERLERERASLPDFLRPPKLDSDQLAIRLFALDAASEEASLAVQRCESARGAFLSANNDLNMLERRRATEVEGVALTAIAGADLHLAALVANGEIKSGSNAPVRSVASIDAVLAWSVEAGRWCETHVRRLVALRVRVREAMEALELHFAGALAEVPAASATEVDGLVIGARSERDVLGDRLVKAEADLIAARAVEERLRAVEPLALGLEQLKRYLQADGFKDYLMRRRERRLLGVATEILRKMTAGRYAFAERFQMLDAQTQQTRDPRTLSGGEKFLASLALALGLVEIAAEAGGPLDALFLDEGFGSLDSNALDIALSELAGRATSGKMIGVITHVRGVAAEIETILRVQRLPGGSVVTKLTASEREEMLDDATVSGLLEAAV